MCQALFQALGRQQWTKQTKFLLWRTESTALTEAKATRRRGKTCLVMTSAGKINEAGKGKKSTCWDRASAVFDRMTSKGLSEKDIWGETWGREQGGYLGKDRGEYKGPKVGRPQSRAARGSAWPQAGGMRENIRSWAQRGEVGLCCFIPQPPFSNSFSVSITLRHATVTVTRAMLGQAKLLNGLFKVGPVRTLTATFCTAILLRLGDSTKVWTPMCVHTCVYLCTCADPVEPSCFVVSWYFPLEQM